MNDVTPTPVHADPVLLESRFRDYHNFAGAKVPELQKEQPHHRHICTLAARGFTPAEIADIVGMSTGHISKVLRQPWARLTMAELQGTVGEQVVRNELKVQSPRAVEILRQAMEGELTEAGVDKEGNPIRVPVTAKASDRINAAKEILTRAYPQLAQMGVANKEANEMTNEELMAIVAGN